MDVPQFSCNGEYLGFLILIFHHYILWCHGQLFSSSFFYISDYSLRVDSQIKGMNIFIILDIYCLSTLWFYFEHTADV